MARGGACHPFSVSYLTTLVATSSIGPERAWPDCVRSPGSVENLLVTDGSAGEVGQGNAPWTRVSLRLC